MELTRWKSSTSVRLDGRRHTELDHDSRQRLSMRFLSSLVDESDESVDWRVPQIKALKQSIAAADRGEFASAQETENLFRFWGA